MVRSKKKSKKKIKTETYAFEIVSSKTKYSYHLTPSALQGWKSFSQKNMYDIMKES